MTRLQTAIGEALKLSQLPSDPVPALRQLFNITLSTEMMGKLRKDKDFMKRSKELVQKFKRLTGVS